MLMEFLNWGQGHKLCKWLIVRSFKLIPSPFHQGNLPGKILTFKTPNLTLRIFRREFIWALKNKSTSRCFHWTILNLKRKRKSKEKLEFTGGLSTCNAAPQGPCNSSSHLLYNHLNPIKLFSSTKKGPVTFINANRQATRKIFPHK